jgi:hypothetical protein
MYIGTSSVSASPVTIFISQVPILIYRCVYVYMYTHSCIYIFLCIYTYTYVYLYFFMYIYRYILFIYSYSYIYLCMYIYIYMYKHLHLPGTRNRSCGGGVHKILTNRQGFCPRLVFIYTYFGFFCHS